LEENTAEVWRTYILEKAYLEGLQRIERQNEYMEELG
jgi:hypothetical protein